MQANANAVREFLLIDFDAFTDFSPERKKSVLSAVGDIAFFGKEKRIDFKPRQVLSEVVRFVRSFAGMFEPLQAGSGSKKEPTVLRSVLFGREESSQRESLHNLLNALERPLFPTIQFPGQVVEGTANTIKTAAKLQFEKRGSQRHQ